MEHSLLEKIQWHLESKQNCRTEFFWDSSCCTFSGVPFPLKQLDTLAVGQLNALTIEIQAHPNLYYRNLYTLFFCDVQSFNLIFLLTHILVLSLTFKIQY